VRWAGVFAPDSPYRRDITLRPEIKKGFQFTNYEDGAEKMRTFKIYNTNFNVEGGESCFIRRLQISAACEAVNAPSSHANGQPARPV